MTYSRPRSSTVALVSVLALASTSRAHMAAWAKGMYCKNGLTNVDSPNANYPVTPLTYLNPKDWFLHGQCRNFPPPKGEMLEIPANGKFTVEITENRAFTTLSYNGTKTTAWGDGKVHPDNWSVNTTDPLFPPSSAGCIGSPNMHCHGKADAAGTAFAISYQNNMAKAKMSDFTVFSILPNTPYRRVATYKVPNLPACPAGGCLCAWGWVADGCGLRDMYQLPYRCNVTGAKKNARKVAKPKAPVWCPDDRKKCVKGAKQLLAVFQKSGDNIQLPPGLLPGAVRPVPGYNYKAGWTTAGAQSDIFVTASASAKAQPIASRALDSAAPAVTDPSSSYEALADEPSTDTVEDLPQQTGW